MKHHVYNPYNNNCNDLQFHTHLFMNISPEWVDDLPEDIEGEKIFKIKCLQSEWVEKMHDLRYFMMHSLRRKGLIGTRKMHG